MKYIVTLLSFFCTSIIIAQDAQMIFSKPTKLSDAVNSSCDELSATISQDGTVLLFSRAICKDNIGGEVAGQDVYMSKKNDDGSWGTAFNLGSVINNKFENAPAGLSEDKNKIFLFNVYRSGNRMSPGLSFSTKKGSDTSWHLPKAIVLKNFKFAQKSFISVSVTPDSKHMVISRYRKDSTDAEDLFISHADDKGNWSEPVNMGQDVNSVGFETSPFLANDSTLYFASNGWGGYGDADIFVSKRLDKSWMKWSRPQNLGNNINTKGFDGYFSVSKNGDAYFVSGDSPDAMGDIYTSKLVRPFNTLTVNLVNSETNAPLNVATVTCSLKEGKELVGKTIASGGKADFKVKPDPAKIYVVVHAEGFISADYIVEQTQPRYNKDTSVTVALAPIKIGQKVSLDHIYFEFGKADLLEESNDQLDVLVELLQENPNMEILIGGHTDNVGDKVRNKTLSESRVKSVDDYLISKGINTQRIKYKGYGDTKPVAKNDTEEGRAKNRRVEFTILKK
ncbi:MAG: OmpA family protein [Bacteroidota bacterium]|nr:OmpA family protein [Bacteroidota bacterium]